MAAHSSILAWRIPRTEEPGGIQSMGGGHGSPLQCSCLENPTDRGGWWATVCGVAKNRTQLFAFPFFMTLSWRMVVEERFRCAQLPPAHSPCGGLLSGLCGASSD